MERAQRGRCVRGGVIADHGVARDAEGAGGAGAKYGPGADGREAGISIGNVTREQKRAATEDVQGAGTADLTPNLQGTARLDIHSGASGESDGAAGAGPDIGAVQAMPGGGVGAVKDE